MAACGSRGPRRPVWASAPAKVAAVTVCLRVWNMLNVITGPLLWESPWKGPHLDATKAPFCFFSPAFNLLLYVCIERGEEELPLPQFSLYICSSPPETETISNIHPARQCLSRSSFTPHFRSLKPIFLCKPEKKTVLWVPQTVNVFLKKMVRRSGSRHSSSVWREHNSFMGVSRRVPSCPGASSHANPMLVPAAQQPVGLSWWTHTNTKSQGLLRGLCRKRSPAAERHAGLFWPHLASRMENKHVICFNSTCCRTNISQQSLERATDKKTIRENKRDLTSVLTASFTENVF